MSLRFVANEREIVMVVAVVVVVVMVVVVMVSRFTLQHQSRLSRSESRSPNQFYLARVIASDLLNQSDQASLVAGFSVRKTAVAFSGYVDILPYAYKKKRKNTERENPRAEETIKKEIKKIEQKRQRQT